MAKKKGGDAPDEPIILDTAAAVAQVVKDLNKEYGAGVAVSGLTHAGRQRHFISVSPSWDMNVGPVVDGTWMLISGPEKSGKSSIALNVCREAQKPENGSRPVFYFDIECRIEKRDLEGARGLDLSEGRFTHIRGVKGAALVTTDHYRAAERVLKDIPGAVVVFDSLSAMVPPSTAENGVNESGDRSSSYRMAGQFCGMLQSVVPANGSIFIGIAHQYNNTGGGQAVWKEKIPNAFKYQGTIHLQVKWGERWRTGGKGDEAKGPQIGIIPHIFVKTASHGTPGTEFPLHLRYGLGIDKTYELLQIGVELGLIEQAYAWLSLPWAEGDDGKPPKAQGAEKMYALLDSRPDWATALAAKIREATE